MRKILLAILTLIYCLPLHASERPPQLIAAIDSLDAVIEQRNRFKDERTRMLDSLKQRLSFTKGLSRVGLLRDISLVYNDIDVDSAFKYLYEGYDLARKIGDNRMREMAQIDYAWLLNRTMLFSDAIATLDSIDTELLDDPGRIHYYSTLGRSNMNAAEHHPGPNVRRRLRSDACEAFDSLNNYFPPGSLEHRLTEAQIDYLKDNFTMGAGELNNILEEITPQHPAYAIVTGMLARYYKDNEQKRDNYLYYLTLSAIHDVLTVNGEPQSLVTLASELSSDGDTDRAYRYLMVASEAFESSKSALLGNTLLQPLSLVNKKIQEREVNTRHNLTLLLVILSFVVILALGIALFERNRRRNLRLREARLREAVATRNLYINQLLEVCAVYVEGLEDFNRLVGRKLKTGQSKDLYQMIESGKIIQEQTERFFTVFDAAVMKIFPTFTDDINSLLQPDKQIVAANSDKLTPEQRIVAFMRLGVTDSVRISKFLGLSLNTVYTYRT
ncbi:MAG: hypothetical protein K2M00_00800, partial [Muribaculaceae bacterium]|nr:hypothetical protein [Muribaculaceae bacterium]